MGFSRRVGLPMAKILPPLSSQRREDAVVQGPLYPRQPRTPEEVEALRREVDAVPAWYHAIDLGDGVVTPGPFELTRTIHHYPIPEDMSGMRVLDVGASNGFYSFEFERRGAEEVVALDLGSWLEHDWGPRKRAEFEVHAKDDVRRFDDQQMRRGFDVVGRALGSRRVRKVEMPIYDIAPEPLGMFDLVFSGAMLMHVRDPIQGICRMRTVCKDDGAIVISISSTLGDTEDPLARFMGEWDQCNFWQMNPACLKRVLAFADFEPTGEEVMYSEDAGGGTWMDSVFVCRARPRQG